MLLASLLHAIEAPFFPLLKEERKKADELGRRKKIKAPPTENALFFFLSSPIICHTAAAMGERVRCSVSQQCMEKETPVCACVCVYHTFPPSELEIGGPIKCQKARGS